MTEMFSKYDVLQILNINNDELTKLENSNEIEYVDIKKKNGKKRKIYRKYNIHKYFQVRNIYNEYNTVDNDNIECGYFVV